MKLTDLAKLAWCLIYLILASCAPVPPRPVIVSEHEVEPINIHPVADASRATRDAVRGVAEAGNTTREAGRKVSDTSRRLSDAIIRAATLTAANRDLEEAMADAKALAAELGENLMSLSAALDLAEQKEKIALETVDAQEAEISTLKESAAAQAAQLDANDREKAALRAQMQEMVELPDKLAIASDKLQWWRWRFAPVTLGIIAAGILVALYRPRIPFM